MQAHYQLNDLTQMGYNNFSKFNRKNINYKRLILGWHMNSDGYEAAVLKRWLESRFGLSPRFHKAKIRDFSDKNYEQYLTESAIGMYNSNAIESQLDIVYSYAQFELGLLENRQLKLYRGVNHLSQHEIFNRQGKQLVILLNNISSFSANLEFAQSFGDNVLIINVPVFKIFCYNPILPKQINSEEEYMVIGGLYQAELM